MSLYSALLCNKKGNKFSGDLRSPAVFLTSESISFLACVIANYMLIYNAL
jgi:hypothetical protein